MSTYLYMGRMSDGKTYFISSTRGHVLSECRKRNSDSEVISQYKVTDVKSASINFHKISAKYRTKPGEYQFKNEEAAKEIFRTSIVAYVTTDDIDDVYMECRELGNVVGKLGFEEAHEKFSLSYGHLMKLLRDDCVVIDGEIYRKMKRRGTHPGDRKTKYGLETMDVGEVRSYDLIDEFERARSSAYQLARRSKMQFKALRGALTIERIK